MITPGIKNVIYLKLFRDLADAEIIQSKTSIWFIDRENVDWYFELQKNGTLWYRFPFFDSFFLMFGIESEEYEPILISWVKTVLNCNVETVMTGCSTGRYTVETVLNCDVETIKQLDGIKPNTVESALNCGVKIAKLWRAHPKQLVEAVLSSDVKIAVPSNPKYRMGMDGVVNYGITAAHGWRKGGASRLKDVLSYDIKLVTGNSSQFAFLLKDVLGQTEGIKIAISDDIRKPSEIKSALECKGHNGIVYLDNDNLPRVWGRGDA